MTVFDLCQRYLIYASYERKHASSVTKLKTM